jgi:uncharacterized protein
VKQLTQDLLNAAASTHGQLGPHAVLLEPAEVSASGDVRLTTDIYHPAGQEAGPVILMRTPYGRANWLNEGIYWASHGFRAVIQDCRGTSSYFAEAGDGAATVAWMERAPWFGDALFLHGRSYLGFTAWATASTRPASLRGMSVQVYSSDRVSAWYPGGTFALDLALPWAAFQGKEEDKPKGERHVQASTMPRDFSFLITQSPAFNHLPLEDADIALGGQIIPFYRERLRYHGNDPHWAPLNFSSLLTEIEVPVLLIDGWNDFHRRYMWQDFERLRARRQGHTRLVIGPWSHITVDVRVVTSETLRWFRGLATRAAAPRASLRLYVTPDRGWAEASEWPPSGASAATFYLGADRTLSPTPVSSIPADSYVYDPADPTPAVGLASFGAEGPADNRALEARSDVLIYTAPPNEHAVMLAGSVRARLFVNSTRPTADFFVRITDVHPNGASINVADGITRLADCPQLQGEQPVPVDVDLGPVAHQMSAGHALRVQVSSGAHPVYARNNGSTEPHATSTLLYAARQQVHLSGLHASHITLPVLHDQVAVSHDEQRGAG